MEDIAMALSQKHRSSIYQRLSPMLGEEEAEALLSKFPARDLDEPVTQGFVRAEIADVRAEFAGLRGEFAGLRAEFGDLRGEFGELRGEVRTQIADVRTEIAGVEARLTEQMRQQTIWFLGALIAAMGVISAIVSALR
jgi:hypothetical protein